jgi:hypothetical protein
MTDITIRTIGNRALYRSLYESIDSKTRHRSIGGAMRRIAQIEAASKVWATTMGNWGRVEITIDGRILDDYEADALQYDFYFRHDATERRHALKRAWQGLAS